MSSVVIFKGRLFIHLFLIVLIPLKNSTCCIKPRTLICISLWLVAIKPIFKFRWGLVLVPGVTGWRPVRKGLYTWLLVSCLLWQRHSPLLAAAPRPWAPGSSAVGPCSALTSAVSAWALLLSYCSGRAGVAVSSVGAAPRPASLHPCRATSPVFPYWTSRAALGFWFLVLEERPCFTVNRENTAGCKKRILQLDTAWTALSVLVTPAVQTLISSLSYAHSPRFSLLPFPLLIF